MSAGVVRHVGVVGAGLAGLATALAVASAGVAVDLYDQASAPPALPVPIDLVPNLLRDLASLGLGEACVRHGFPYQGMAVCDAEGRHHVELPTPHLAGPRWPAAVGMVYGELLALLRDAARQQGARLHAGVTVHDAGPDGRLRADGMRPHRHDLIVVASGLQLPQIAGRAARPLVVEQLPQQWCHALLPRPIGLEQAVWVLGPDATKLMVVPVDARRVGVAVQQPLGSDTSAGALRARLGGHGRWLERLVAAWTDRVPVVLRPVASGLLSGPWHADGVLRIGNAAHVLPPQFGQAAAQSVEDAVVLGALLRAGLPRDVLLERFMARRGERARQVHAAVTQAARWDLRPEAATDLPALARRLALMVALPA